jgi:hypothetical protein
MANEFEILAGFLARYGDEVEGRELQDLPREVQVKLRELAQGSLPESERSRLFGLLKENPAWIGRLAEEVKALRTEGNR